MKRIITFLAFLLCVLVVNAQGYIIRERSQKRTSTQNSTAAKRQNTIMKFHAEDSGNCKYLNSQAKAICISYEWC